MFSADALRVIKAATDLNADPGKALVWYRNEPLSAFGDKTAEQLASEGRTDELVRCLGSDPKVLSLLSMHALPTMHSFE